jgi:hypothetical protein
MLGVDVANRVRPLPSARATKSDGPGSSLRNASFVPSGDHATRDGPEIWKRAFERDPSGFLT